MLIYFAADWFGDFEGLFRQVQRLETIYGLPRWIVHIGNSGAWPDPRRVDRATRRATNIAERTFIRYYAGVARIPYPTLFLPGKHEDHAWLKEMLRQKYLELIPNLHRLVTGYKRILPGENEELSVVGIGGVFSPQRYYKAPSTGEYYTETDIQRACGQGPVDLLLSTEAGKGARFGTLESQALGINNVAFATRPKLMVHAHYGQTRLYTSKLGIETLSLGRRTVLPVRWAKGEFEFLSDDVA